VSRRRNKLQKVVNRIAPGVNYLPNFGPKSLRNDKGRVDRVWRSQSSDISGIKDVGSLWFLGAGTGKQSPWGRAPKLAKRCHRSEARISRQALYVCCSMQCRACPAFGRGLFPSLRRPNDSGRPRLRIDVGTEARCNTPFEPTPTLVSVVSIGTLSTISPKHRDVPFGSLMPFALDPAGRPHLPH
jgi:hypothetical protein